MRVCILVILCLLASGCQPEQQAAVESTPDEPTVVGGSSEEGGGIAPMTPSAVPNAPVAGSESLQGSGGGSVGQAAKSRAKDAAAQYGGANQTPADGE